jgi:predicted transcriptional regulator
MIQWAAKYGHPAFYNLEGEFNKDEFLTIKDLWNVIWNAKIEAQPVWRDLAFYNLLGTVIDERIDDYRMHIIFSSYSSTGKDEGLNIIQKILDDLDYQTGRPASVTDRTLVGAMNQDKAKYNINHNLTEENQVNGKHEYKDPKEYGDLKFKNWLAFGESESVFKPSSHNRLIQIILRQAMDKSRQVERGVGGETIKISTNTSFILVTYVMDDIVYKILNNGLFQRAIYYNKDLTQEEHDKIRTHINKSRFNNDIRKRFPEAQYFKAIEDRLRFMKMWYNENKNDIKYVDLADEYINKLWVSLEQEYKALPDVDRAILDSIIRRGSINLYKLCMLTAIWKMKTTITHEDITECFNLLRICINSVKELVLKFNKDSKQVAVILYLLKDGPKYTADIDTALETQMNLKSSRTKVKVRNKLIEMGLIYSMVDSGRTLFSITEKGKDLIE